MHFLFSSPVVFVIGNMLGIGMGVVYHNFCSISIVSNRFYRAMHFSAKRGIAIACRLSVCLSVCNVGEL